MAPIAQITKPQKDELNDISNIEKQFNRLADKWKRETGLYAIPIQKVNDTYREIIANGKVYLPFILKDMQKGGSVNWHLALLAITGFNPFPDNNVSKSKIVKEAWIEWGKKNHII